MLSFIRKGKETLPPITTIEFPTNHILSGYKIRIFTTSQLKQLEHEAAIPEAIEAMINKEEANFSSLTTKIRVDIFNRNQERYPGIITSKKDFITALEEIVSKESQENRPSKKARIGGM